MQEKTKTIIRWVLVPIASYAAIYLVGVVLFFASIISIFPFSDFMLTLIALASGFFSVLVGTMVAPAYKIRSALVISLAVLLYSFPFGRDFHSDLIIHAIGIVVGSLMATALLWLWIRPGNLPATHPNRKPILFIGGILILAFGGILFARFIDYPATSDVLPPHSGLKNMEISEFHSYRLAGFIDETYFWRMDIDEGTLLKMVDTFNFEQITEVQDDFFHWRPYWWPKKLPANYLAFRSPGYEIGTRPSDAWYYYLVYDQDKQRAYIWVDQNF